MKKLLSLLVLTALMILHCNNVSASCMATSPPPIIELQIEKAVGPVFDYEGKQYPGCLLLSAGRVDGYSNENSLCQRQYPRKLKLQMNYGCCDTGPNYGELVCILRTDNGKQVFHANGVFLSTPKWSLSIKIMQIRPTSRPCLYHPHRQWILPPLPSALLQAFRLPLSCRRTEYPWIQREYRACVGRNWRWTE